jgi:hypothetical protein
VAIGRSPRAGVGGLPHAKADLALAGNRQAALVCPAALRPKTPP